MKYYHRYVCDPNMIMITAENSPTNSRGIKITFLLNNKEVFNMIHTLKMYTPTKDDIDTHIARCCNFIKGTTEDYIQDRFEEDNIMGILNIHRFLTKVRTPSGKTVWRSDHK